MSAPDPSTPEARSRPRSRWRAVPGGSLQLRTRLLLTVLALLTVACAAVGVLGHAALSVSLGEQLDREVQEASYRTVEYGVRASAGAPEGTADMLDAPAQGAGTLNARIVGDEVVRAGLFTTDGTRQRLADEDRERIARSWRSSGPSRTRTAASSGDPWTWT